MEVQNVHGYGLKGGPNENTLVNISGWVGPFDNTVGCNLRIEADHVTSEPALYASFPQDVRDAMELLRAKQASTDSKPRSPYDGFPQFHGKFVCDVIMPIGEGTKPTVSTDITFDDGSAALAVFPYPLRHLARSRWIGRTRKRRDAPGRHIAVAQRPGRLADG
jgi:hypothetical protein